jgi:hypothetical protein
MLKDDEEAVVLILKLINLEIEEEDQWSQALDELEQYAPGAAEILIKSKKLPDPREILSLAREQNQPILL